MKRLQRILFGRCRKCGKPVYSNSKYVIKNGRYMHMKCVKTKEDR